MKTALIILVGLSLYLGGQLLASFSTNADLRHRLAQTSERLSLSEELRKEQALAHNLKYKELLDEEVARRLQGIDDADPDIVELLIPDGLREILRDSGRAAPAH